MFRSEKGLEIPRLSKPEAQVKDDSSAMPASSFACASGLNTWGFCLPSSQVRNFQTYASGYDTVQNRNVDSGIALSRNRMSQPENKNHEFLLRSNPLACFI